MSPSALREDAAIPAGEVSVATLAWRFRGVVRVTVIAKATFAFVPDGVMTRVAPQPIVRAEVHHGGSPARSIRLTTDLAPYLTSADVLLTGSAHAPRGVFVETLPVRLGVFNGSEPVLDKTVLVRQAGGVKRVPLVYERAYGGIGWADNPLGVGVPEGSGVPGLLDPFDDKRRAGFGPIGQGWPVRKRLLGSLGLRALDAGGVVDLPDDLDWEYFQSAPVDQRVPFLRGDEWIVMDGLHPRHARLRTSLPGARGVSLVHGLAPWGVPDGQPVALHVDMLRIDGDEERCTLTFRATFPVADEAALPRVRVITGIDLPGQPIPWPDPASILGGEEPDGAATALTSVDLVDMPTQAGDASSPGNVLEGTLTFSPEQDAVPGAGGVEKLRSTLTEPGGASARPALPFARADTVTPGSTLPRSTPLPAPSKGLGTTQAASFDELEGFDTLPFAERGPVASTPFQAPRSPAGVAVAPTMDSRPPPATAIPGSSGAATTAGIPALDPSIPRSALPVPPQAPVEDFRAVRVVHETPFAVAVTPSKLASGTPAMTVTAAATCDLVALGPARIRPRAEPLTEDLAGLKARADVTLAGHAHAPSPGARRGEVSFRFGSPPADEGPVPAAGFERQIAVFGDRCWRRAGKALPTITEPEPFERIPLDLEHAYGGPGYRPNPLGRSHDLPIRRCDQAPLPNLEDPEHLIRSLAHEPDPACPAPLPRELRPGGQAAPGAQQLGFLAGDEPYVITGVRPRRAAIKGALPGARARGFALSRAPSPSGAAVVEIPLQLDTAAFDADAMTLRLVFRGTLPVADEATPGWSVAALLVILETPGGEKVTLEQARSRLEGC